jgi:predicted nucleotidyltransferase
MTPSDLKKIHNVLLPTLDFKPVFITISGAHLYGFESYNSDLDLRGLSRPQYFGQKFLFENLEFKVNSLIG